MSYRAIKCFRTKINLRPGYGARENAYKNIIRHIFMACIKWRGRRVTYILMPQVVHLVSSNEGKMVEVYIFDFYFRKKEILNEYSYSIH